MKPDIWMPLYIGDYLSDTMHLTTEQHGAYLLLLMAYWKNGTALHESSLLSITKLTPDAWSIAQALLSPFFDTVSSPGYWIHRRVEKELIKASDKKRRATDKAKAAAKVRWKTDA